MDPVANVEEQVTLARAIVARASEEPAEAVRLAELVLAQDGWRRRGGFDPYGAVRS